MLNLSKIRKVYPSGDVTALHEVSIAFRPNEFVSILGPSGCGKTTLLNIIGGLDRYTSGELYVRHKPTAEFKDRDWDTYRNHSIGFVFQSYNLIPHQTVLANVELALTLSGVSKSERRKRAEEALRAVGLGDQLKKKPSQMSGGQMQRVAIARALVNDPDILLADEPTGALDSETSVQIMEILRSIAKNKLIIMVTHNPELAEKYSTRIIRLLDGNVISDSNPYSDEEEKAEVYTQSGEYLNENVSRETLPQTTEKSSGRKKRTSMSFATALGLSLNNLMTKKARTLLTAFAGSIGIIGIALILSLSNGINVYIDKVQEDTLSAYPLEITRESVDMTSMITALTEARESVAEDEAVDGVIKSNTMMYDLMDSMMSIDVQKNNLTDFISYIDEHGGDLDGYASAVSYGYDVPLYIYSSTDKDENGVPTRLNPSTMFDGMMQAMSPQSAPAAMTRINVWDEMPSNMDLIRGQYDVIAGRLPESWNEVVLIVDSRNKINDVYLYALGFKDSGELDEMMKAAMRGEEFNAESEEFTYDDFLEHEFSLLTASDMYRKSGDLWEYAGDNALHMTSAVSESEKITIVGIIRPSPEAVATSLNGAIGYLPSLTEHIMAKADESDVVKAQLASPETDILTALPFKTEENDPANLTDSEKAEAIRGAIEKMNSAEAAAVYTDYMANHSDSDAEQMAEGQLAAMSAEEVNALVLSAMMQSPEAQGMDETTIKAYLSSMSAEEVNSMAKNILTEAVKSQAKERTEESLSSSTSEELSAALDALLAGMSDADVISSFGEYMPATVSETTLRDNLTLFGQADRGDPSYILIYADTFASKDEISRMITEYNSEKTSSGREEDVIHYTDYVALMMSSISTIINVISYVLIAFVSISLVVSSIMIGIITYISVLERTKEIGILRAVGASKKDISRVFNAETLIVGFAAGAIGIGVTLLLCIPANVIIKSLTDISNLARLPAVGGVILVLISMALTLIAGLIPSHLAAKKDPVEALRNE
ncbi:MAG: ATP-binding cassette domain-containing protein [Eubacteriales bacterium]